MKAFESNGNRLSTPTPQSEELEFNTPETSEPSKSTIENPPIEAIYRDANIETHQSGYTVLKVAGMAASPHLAGMSPEARRSAILMALQAAGVDLSVIVSDAISRQRALHDHEELLARQLKDFETDVSREIAALQEECDRVVAQCKSRIQANKDEVARQQTAFHSWQKLRRAESQRISSAASMLIPPDSVTGGESLAALLERSAAQRR